jgi:hypothetical protein
LRFILANINVQFKLCGGTDRAIYLDKKDHDGLRTNDPIDENTQSEFYRQLPPSAEKRQR